MRYGSNEAVVRPFIIHEYDAFEDADNPLAKESALIVGVIVSKAVR